MLCKTFIGMVASIALAAGTASAWAQGTAITYQGQLKSSGATVNTVTDMEFSLWTEASGGSQVGSTVNSLAVPVSQGLFTTPVDFGVNPYTSSQNLFLQIAVRNPAGVGAYVPMGSRQLLTPAPFSLATRGIDVDANGNIYPRTNASVNITTNINGAGARGFVHNYRAHTFGTWGGNGCEPNVGIGTFTNSGFNFFINKDNVQCGTVAAFDANGNFCIGNPYPQARLDVRGGDAVFSNKVGIGTTVPFNRLDVAAGSTIGNSTLIGQPNDVSNRGTKVGFGYHTPADGCGPDNFRGMRVEVVEGSTFCGNSTDLTFWTDECNTSCPREVMRINGSGNVGIGTASPGAFGGFRLDVGGNIRCVNLTQTSSRDFKQNITPLTGALDSIMKLKGVSYAWNDQAPEQVRGNRDIGFIADEMNQVLPDIVAKDQSGKPIGIDYGKVTPVAVEAIKQLKNENDLLKARLEKIEAILAAQPRSDAK